MTPFFFEDFTTANYRRLLKTAKARYSFRTYAGLDLHGLFVLWRHDVDFSPQRALALAKIERQEHVRATYFIHLHSLFYNMFEPGVTGIFREIAGLGHAIGLHFDPTCCQSGGPRKMAQWLRWETGILKKLLAVEISAFSFHNPTAAILRKYQAFRYGGLINTYARYFRTEVGYCSDSNGYWRNGRLEDVLRAERHPRLQILTHPEWWQEQAMAPRRRVQRCIDGRAQQTARYYDALLRQAGRVNVKK